VETLYDAPARVLPHGVGVGSTWNYTMTGTSMTHAGTTAPFTVEVEYEVDRETSVTVPAGTFTVLEITGTTVSTTSTPFKQWLDASVGAVATDNAELRRVSP
jgi:hypothetical protein